MLQLLFGILVIGVLSFLLNLKSERGASGGFQKKISDSLTPVDTTRDSPVGFGYKCMWVAVKSTDQSEIADFIGLQKAQMANWQSGIENAYNGKVFITPPVDGWILLVGYGLPQERTDDELIQIKNFVNKLSKQFGEAQHFASHRVVDYHCWIKSINGELVRVYSFIGESFKNIEVFGELSEVEKKYKFGNTLSKEAMDESYYEREDLVYPDEEIVMEIAESWSVNPTNLDGRTDIVGLGLVGVLI